MHRRGITDAGDLSSLPTLIWRHACMHLQLQIQASLCQTHGLLLIIIFVCVCGLNCHALFTSLISAVLLILKAQVNRHFECECCLLLSHPG